MKRIARCDEGDYAALLGIWVRSVRATHDFLDEDAISELREALIPVYFPNVELYALSDDESIVGFVGLSEGNIEMLFVDGDKLGRGHGSALMEFAVKKGATRVDVNEQNPSALGFYQAKGFRVVGRDATDSAGRSYPILHLSL